MSAPPSPDHDGFDALAAASERTDSELLPSLLPLDDSAAEVDDDLVTEDDLAHLTGAAAPDANDWTTLAPPMPITEPERSESDDGVPRFVVIPLIAAAVMAVVFVAYSIVTESPPQRPDAVALIDRTTTTAAPPVTTAEATVAPNGAVPIGVDIAEQAERMCRGDQFSIARSTEPSTAIYNDVMVAVQDGRSDWDAAPDQEMLRGPVPPLIGCLRTADAGEIDRCPTTAAIISRRSVSWSYRVLRTIDGVEVGSDSGTASEMRPCEQLELEAAGSDFGSWSPLPTQRLDAAARDYTTAPHPQQACVALLEHRSTMETERAEGSDLPEPVDPETPVGPGLAVHATAYATPGIDHPLPVGWPATGERPVEAVLCLIPTADLDRIVVDDAGDRATTSDETTQAGAPPNGDAPPDGATKAEAEPPIPAPPAGCSITVAALLRSGEWIGSWEYVSESCPGDTDPLVPEPWLEEVVGPELGYPLDVGESSPDGVADGE